MTKIIISFQFSPVRTIKIEINDFSVFIKLYLAGSPSSSSNSSPKNYLANNAEMNRNKIVSTPKLPIAERDFNTVYSKSLSDFHDLIILNTLVSLKALSTESPEFSD